MVFPVTLLCPAASLLFTVGFWLLAFKGQPGSFLSLGGQLDWGSPNSGAICKLHSKS